MPIGSIAGNASSSDGNGIITERSQQARLLTGAESIIMKSSLIAFTVTDAIRGKQACLVISKATSALKMDNTVRTISQSISFCRFATCTHTKDILYFYWYTIENCCGIAARRRWNALGDAF
ncbi:MAG: hypothetical protein U5K79_23225 [Cyclobacteriaceae bacterium]|nr:hypothetical protein [Cyclobacteriaceae bacterium]